MEIPPRTTETLLKKLLQNPSEENYEQMAAFISGAGYEDFISSLKRNNTLSIIFLKNYVQRWIDSNTLQNFYSEEFITFLIQCCIEGVISNSNWVHVADFLEVLSNNYLISEQTVQLLIDRRVENQRVFILIDSVFKKYTVHPRSNRLFAEINRSIEMFFPVFVELFFTPAIIDEVDKAYQEVLVSAQRVMLGESNELIHTTLKARFDTDQEYILSIFYSLTYQDIHPYFEDNIQHFLKIFFILFNQNQIIVNQIFDLFISKYPEITNFDLIILTLSRIDTLDGLIVNTLTNAFNYSRSFPAVILGFLRRTLRISKMEDWLTTTQNLVRGNDVQRGFVHRLIRLLNCDVHAFEGEPKFFVAAVLRFKDQSLLNEAFSAIKTMNTDTSLIFTIFRYLLTVQEYSECNLEYLNTDVRFICMKYLSNFLKSKDAYHRDILLSSRIFNHSSGLQSVSPNALTSYLGLDVNKVLSILTASLDEFSSELLFRIVKCDETLLTPLLYDIITRLFKNILKIPLTSLTYILDIYILLSIKLKRYNLELIETIFNEEMIDFYNVCFLYISVLMRETDVKQNFILQILSQDELWKTKELHSGLSFILISAYEMGIINRAQIESISQFLDGYTKILVLHKLSIQMTGEYTEEENYLVNGIFDGNWFLESFMNKKYARLVLKKLVRDENVPIPIKQKVIEKNLINVEYENVLHSIVKYFDI
ncbi:uncharacterized protein VICG_01847 [Vittaforma corneae ATCC 50505]|uniref:Exportin-2 central domain-containing protein n=1 Tax=Vittaforma corneae (strain ATCC 50505) TaxID=993615 RepID=L2GJV1_VITCO|nr:uncharacterized protein VICG_01847 [Vittaforma corneae ATCC 50505]ELA41148.1 hypothetical protein VICG_01847 [Vittaforma corneae ATCC 50505]